MTRALLLLAACAALLLACDDGDGDGSTATTTATAPSTEGNATGTASPATSTATPEMTAEPTTPPVADPGPVGVEVAHDVTFDRAVDVMAYPVGDFDVLVADQSGIIRALRGDEATTVLDLSAQVLRAGNEEGLLSVALDPAFASNNRVWVYYSAASPRRTVLSRLTANDDGVIAPGTELVVLEVEQPYANHNGGSVRFGPDGMLYLGLGDGGDGGDPHGNGQDLGTLLGSIVRLDVSESSEDEPYAVPDDNPFVDEDGARPEIWAYGVRNPWRMAFDPVTSALWVADVGQNAIEEVSIAAAGDNLGWKLMEGDRCFQPAQCNQDGLVLPLAVYDHGGGRCSVSGGAVARQVTATNVEGSFLYGDFCSGELWALPSTAATEDGVEPVLVASGLGNISSIAQVGEEIIVLAFGQPIMRVVDR